jgi:hypothetical protein
MAGVLVEDPGRQKNPALQGPTQLAVEAPSMLEYLGVAGSVGDWLRQRGSITWLKGVMDTVTQAPLAIPSSRTVRAACGTANAVPPSSTPTPRCVGKRRGGRKAASSVKSTRCRNSEHDNQFVRAAGLAYIVHEKLPEVATKVPAAQSVHTPASARENFPAAHRSCKQGPRDSEGGGGGKAKTNKRTHTLVHSGTTAHKHPLLPNYT